jgi:hypothetical protein
MGKKDTPVKLDTRLMYFDLLKLRQEWSLGSISKTFTDL